MTETAEPRPTTWRLDHGPVCAVIEAAGPGRIARVTIRAEGDDPGTYRVSYVPSRDDWAALVADGRLMLESVGEVLAAERAVEEAWNALNRAACDVARDWLTAGRRPGLGRA